MDDEDEDRRGRGQGPRLPPRRRHAGHLPRLQGLQHLAGLGERLAPCMIEKFHVVVAFVSLRLTDSEQ
jgi:hypothetical protein